jgi:hypothetical protein
MGISSTMLVFGVTMRSKALSEPLSWRELFTLVSVTGKAVVILVVVDATLPLVLGLFADELRQVLQDNPKGYGVAHPYIGYLPKPNSTISASGKNFRALYHVDTLGFRNRGPWPEQADITIVGDSVVFGSDVNDAQAWPAVLARSLPHSHVVNLGLIGAGPQQYLRIYETFGVKLHPKLLLVGVFRDDFWDADVFESWLRSGVGGNYMVWRNLGTPEWVRFSFRHPLLKLKSFLRMRAYPAARRSNLFNLLRAIRAGVDRESAETPTVISFPDGGRLELRPGGLVSHAEMGRLHRREFHLAIEAFRRIRSVAAQHGTQTLMILIPSKEETYLPLLGEDAPSPTSALRVAFEELRIDYLDLAPAFRRKAAEGERLFFETDGHHNGAGYSLIAQLVASHLQQTGWQPRSVQ